MCVCLCASASACARAQRVCVSALDATAGGCMMYVCTYVAFYFTTSSRSPIRNIHSSYMSHCLPCEKQILTCCVVVCCVVLCCGVVWCGVLWRVVLCCVVVWCGVVCCVVCCVVVCCVVVCCGVLCVCGVHVCDKGGVIVYGGGGIL